MQVKVEVTFNRDGSANITLPGQKVKATDPAAISKLTQEIADSLGTVTERHAAHIHIPLDDGTEVVKYLEQGQGND